ncbi:MAG: 3-hydroxyacyl-CoA dehydrogenase NAD-binding domain-containing protein [Pseudomonadota bacterium]
MVNQVAILGAGLMGSAIASVFAAGGHTVTVHDPVAESLDALPAKVRQAAADVGADGEALLSTITACPTLGKAVAKADLVIEAVPEKLALKQAVFAEVEVAAPAGCLFASNTSVLPITEIMGALTDKRRALGTHWWNPPHMIPLVEVIATAWTAPDAIDTVMAVLAALGKAPVRVNKDVPGFIGNRLQHALWREAISLVESGVCDAEAVDTVVKESFGRRLAVLGPLENADLVGTDLTLDIHATVLAHLEARPGPSPLLEQLVKDGALGMKTGKGFRTWTQEESAATRQRLATHLSRLPRILDP